MMCIMLSTYTKYIKQLVSGFVNQYSSEQKITRLLKATYRAGMLIRPRIGGFWGVQVFVKASSSKLHCRRRISIIFALN